MPNTATFAAILLGASTGGIAKGVTGYGSAILMALCWVVFTTFVGDAGSLTDAVVTDCIVSVVAALPLLWMTKAHQTTDWRLVGTILVFKNLFSPLGSWMLVTMNKRLVQLVMACMLLVVIFLTTLPDIKKALAKLMRQQHNDRNELGDENSTQDFAAESKSDPIYTHDNAGGLLQDASQELTIHVSSHHHQNEGFSAVEHITGSSSIGKVQHAFASTMFIDQLPASQSMPLEHGSKPPEKITLVDAAPDEMADVPLLGDAHEDSDAAASSLTDSTAAKPPGSLTLQQRWGQLLTALARLYGATKLFLANPDNRRVLFWGTIAGSASGVCEGLTGIGGPPIMLLYLKLGTPRDIARGTGALSSVIQVRIIAYAKLGVIKRDFALLYSIATVAHVGLMLMGGLLLYRYVSQAAFGRCLLILMSLCCLLLFAAAADVGGRAGH